MTSICSLRVVVVYPVSGIRKKPVYATGQPGAKICQEAFEEVNAAFLPSRPIRCVNQAVKIMMPTWI
jgi:hypothetical protein